MSLDRARLLSIALNHWLSFKDYSQEPSPEDKRRFAVCERKHQEHGRWRALLEELRRELDPKSIRIATPCSERWEDMRGDEPVATALTASSTSTTWSG